MMYDLEAPVSNKRRESELADCELTDATAVCMYTQSLADFKAESVGQNGSA